MSLRKLLFVDRDGCLIEEPSDFQVDRYDKFSLLPGVVAALQRCVAAGYELVMITNQDGLGTPSFPEEDFRGPHELLLRVLASQGIRFVEVLIDRSFAGEGLDTRKPGTGMVRHWLARDDWSRACSAMVGDRDTDLQFAANVGVRGLRVGNAPDALDWCEIAHRLCDAPRTAEVARATRETRIRVRVDLDAGARAAIRSGLGFFDHMLEQIARHAAFSLEIDCEGDTHVDDHHTIEDCALALGQALREALGDKRGIGRYGFTLPMDESLASAVIDLSGRPYLVFDGQFPRERVGEVATELVPHFFRSLCETLGANVHLSVRGENAHHMVEACFKVFARALGQAIRVDGDELPSTKGVL
ncbi:MAG: bifunctional histidinol-phosphatase/imidazoleglycerol-phosphate dehydratase HisB [Xanthomonadales bacterium]|nr:bifunctional histidinol-phosphatase/imidazoleglycerol-phosphate dehydratase HisB [Xanthomonadales bacterium]